MQSGKQKKKSNRRCVPLTFDFQSTTFILSLSVQLAVIIFSVAALVAKTNTSETLSTILTLETVVQSVEFVWYLVVGVLFLYGFNISVVYRYIDWVVTTPVMLVTLLLFLLFLNEPCLKYDAIVEKQENFWVLVIVSVIADLSMLCLGLYYERMSDSKGPLFLLFGTFALLVAFIPHAIVLYEHFSWLGLEALVVTLVVWALYGLVAFVFRKQADEKTKNGCYNVLDIFSKNVAGVIVSVCALHATC